MKSLIFCIKRENKNNKKTNETMSASMNETPIKTPQSSKHTLTATENMLSTPLFVPPTPMLKELGYGTGTYYDETK